MKLETKINLIEFQLKYQNTEMIRINQMSLYENVYGFLEVREPYSDIVRHKHIRVNNVDIDLCIKYMKKHFKNGIYTKISMSFVEILM